MNNLKVSTQHFPIKAFPSPFLLLFSQFKENFVYKNLDHNLQWSLKDFFVVPCITTKEVRVLVYGIVGVPGHWGKRNRKKGRVEHFFLSKRHNLYFFWTYLSIFWSYLSWGYTLLMTCVRSRVSTGRNLCSRRWRHFNEVKDPHVRNFIQKFLLASKKSHTCLTYNQKLS